MKAAPVRPTENSSVGISKGEIRRMWGLEDIDEQQDKGADESDCEQDNIEECFEEENKRREEGEESRERREAEQEQISEDASRPKYKNVEPRPSRKEVEEHMITHIPFRTWCPHSVRGKARAVYHKRNNSGEKHVPIIGMDYMYMKSEQTEERGMPI